LTKGERGGFKVKVKSGSSDGASPERSRTGSGRQIPAGDLRFASPSTSDRREFPVDKKQRNDFELCCEVSKKVATKYGGRTQAIIYPENERVVVLVWTAAGIIENGGFRYLFGSVLPGDAKCAHTIIALTRIGCVKAAEIVQRAVCLFPDCLPHRYDVERIRWYESQPEDIKVLLDTEFLNELDNITTGLAKYIRELGLDKMY